MERYKEMENLQAMLHLLSLHSMAMDVENYSKVKRKINFIGETVCKIMMECWVIK